MSLPYRSRSDLEVDIAEKTEDLLDFQKALDLIHLRLLHSQENSQSPMPLHKWAGAMGIRDLLDVVVNNMGRVRDDLVQMREQYPEDKPRLRLVE